MSEFKTCDAMMEENRPCTGVEHHANDQLRPWRLVDHEGNEVVLKHRQTRAALMILQQFEALGNERDNAADGGDGIGLAALSLILGIARSIDPNTGKVTRWCVPPSGLHVCSEERRVYVGSEHLPINSHTDFDVFATIYEGAGKLCSFAYLLRVAKPDCISKFVESLSQAPPEIKQAVRNIRRACRRIGAPDFIEVVKGRGYRHRNLPGQPPFSRLSSALSSSPFTDHGRQRAARLAVVPGYTCFPTQGVQE